MLGCALAAAFFSGCVPLAQPEPEISIGAAVAAVQDSIERVRRQHQTLPHPENDADKLLRIGELDQAPRNAMSGMNLGALDASKRQALWSVVGDVIDPIDRANQKQVLELLPPEGWFAISRYGREAARAAFFVVQHADQTLWRKFLPKIEEMVRSGEAEGPSYALMYDRLALSEGRPQRYGSQMACQDGRYVTMEPMEEIGKVDDRRIAIGLIPYSDYLRIYEEMSC